MVSSLTGSLSADFSDLSACGLLDLKRREVTSLPLEALGLPARTVALFPAPQPSGALVGRLLPEVALATGLPQGLPVVAGCMDCVASTLGTGAEREGDLAVIVGTWAINGVIAPASAPPPDVTISALMPDPSLVLCMEVSPTSASNLEWLAMAVEGPGAAVPVQVLLDEAEEIPPGADGLLFLPFVNGGIEPGASGAFVGLSAFHRRGHLARAVLEGVAHLHRVQLGRVAATGLVADGRPARLAGGGARSELWTRILADVTGRTLLRHQERELGALGVARLVPEAVGRDRPDWFTAAGAVETAPRPNRDVYRAQADVFDAVLAAMPPVWRSLRPGGDV
jgi:L-xylulokinase